jgi:hypothetical protein
MRHPGGFDDPADAHRQDPGDRHGKPPLPRTDQPPPHSPLVHEYLPRVVLAFELPRGARRDLPRTNWSRARSHVIGASAEPARKETA